MLRALLIEDNPAARVDLRECLKAHPEVVIINETDSVGRARPMLARGDYDLVFLDIQLRGGDGFELLPLVVPTARVIFVTSHDEYAVRAFEVNALDYLLKPVSPPRLASCLQRLTPGQPNLTSAPFGAPLRADDLVCISTSDGSQLVPLQTIAVILAEQNYTSIWLTSGQRRLMRRPLKDWEESLANTDFIRTSRDSLINLRQVLRYGRTGEKGAVLWVQGHAEPVRASYRHWSVVRAALSRHLGV